MYPDLLPVLDDFWCSKKTQTTGKIWQSQVGLSEQAALKDHLQKATSALKEMKVQLKDAQMISLLNSMKRLRDIEGRGNVKVDRQSGRVTPVRPIEFLPEAPPKEKGPFKVTWICSIYFV